MTAENDSTMTLSTSADNVATLEELVDQFESARTRAALAREAAETALVEAEGAWSGWDWTQDVGADARGEPVYYDGPGERIENWDAWMEERTAELASEHGEAVAAEIAAAQRAYGEDVQADADASEVDRVAALDALLGDGTATALKLAERAAGRERAYGDDPTYRPVVEALQALRAAEEALVEASAAATAASEVDIDDSELEWREDFEAASLVCVRLDDGWWADDGNAAVEYESADSARDAAEEYAEAFESDKETTWVTIYTWRRAVGTLSDGREVEGVYGWRSRAIEIEPPEPACVEGEEHNWQSPYEILGGLKENPGVWANGGGVVIHEVCMHCGCGRTIDTWAQNRETGEQGLRSVRYEARKYVDEIPSREERELEDEIACKELRCGAAHVLARVRELLGESAHGPQADVPDRAIAVGDYCERVFSATHSRRALRLALWLAARDQREANAIVAILELAHLG